MSEKPNPSLDCASLVRFSVLPLYHGGELQSCWAVIRSSSLLQTPSPNPLHPLLSLSLWTIQKNVFIFFTSLLCLVFTSTSPRICLVRKRAKRRKKKLKSSKTHQRNWVGREEEICEKNVKRADRNFCGSD